MNATATLSTVPRRAIVTLTALFVGVGLIAGGLVGMSEPSVTRASRNVLHATGLPVRSAAQTDVENAAHHLKEVTNTTSDQKVIAEAADDMLRKLSKLEGKDRSQMAALALTAWDGAGGEALEEELTADEEAQPAPASAEEADERLAGLHDPGDPR